MKFIRPHYLGLRTPCILLKFFILSSSAIGQTLQQDQYSQIKQTCYAIEAPIRSWLRHLFLSKEDSKLIEGCIRNKVEIAERKIIEAGYWQKSLSDLNFRDQQKMQHANEPTQKYQWHQSSIQNIHTNVQQESIPHARGSASMQPALPGYQIINPHRATK